MCPVRVSMAKWVVDSVGAHIDPICRALPFSSRHDASRSFAPRQTAPKLRAPPRQNIIPIVMILICFLRRSHTGYLGKCNRLATALMLWKAQGSGQIEAVEFAAASAFPRKNYPRANWRSFAP